MTSILTGYMPELKRIDKKRQPTQERTTYQGVVVKTASGRISETCGHHHKYPDMAMTCARRMRQRRGLW